MKFVHQARLLEGGEGCEGGGGCEGGVRENGGKGTRSIADILGCDKDGADAVRAVTSLQTYFKATLWVTVLFLLLTYLQLWTIWKKNGSDANKLQYFLLGMPLRIFQELFFPIVKNFFCYGVATPGMLVLLTQVIFLDYSTFLSSTVNSMCAIYLCLTGNCDKESNPIMCFPDVLKVGDLMFSENSLFYLMLVSVVVYHYVIAIDMIA